MSEHQKHSPNPSVNRINRKNILIKRIKALSKLKLVTGDIRIKRLSDYRAELKTY